MSIENKSIETIRFSAADAVDEANSGHPGLPLGAAPMAYALFKDHLSFNPNEPKWINRDRFILSAGHGSMLQYALLHLYGYNLSIDEIKNFRQLHSKTPGHPEYNYTDGVETTTGPLGQGLATSVGMAMAEARMNEQYPDLIDHYTYVLCGDGDLMEGVGYEACSLAGHLGLNKLIVLFDSNTITIDGRTDIAFSEDIHERFKSMKWDTLKVEDGNDIEAVSAAIREAKTHANPTLIEVKTIIGFGSPNKADSSAAHGAPLGKDETKQMKENFGWDPEKRFFVPEDVQENFNAIRDEKIKHYDEWMKKAEAHEDYKKLEKQLKKEVSEDVLEKLLEVSSGDKATRVHGHAMINKLHESLPNLFGGSADLAGSNKSDVKGAAYFSREVRDAVGIHYGIREFGMCCVAHGINLNGGYFGYGATFLTFADYMKNGLRVGAIMEVPTVMIFTHDSIGVGEDGPTHQPIEQLAMLRSMPGFDTYRPCDGKETAVAYYEAFKSKRPSAIILTRQDLPEIDMDVTDAHKGAYIIRKEKSEKPELILMASGSEVHLAMEVAEELGENVRVVSFLSMEHFNRQDEAYKEMVLPKDVRKRFAIEAAHPMCWYQYVGLDGGMHTIDHYGESAPADDLFKEYGFTIEQLLEKVRAYHENS